MVEQAFFKSFQHQLGALAAGFGQTAQLGVAVIQKQLCTLVADPGEIDAAAGVCRGVDKAYLDALALKIPGVFQALFV